MNMTRRSFLKAAGLTVVAAASASMFTGCGTFLNPEIEVTYQEVDANGKAVTAADVTRGLDGWSKGKKVVTKNSSLFKVKDDTKEVKIEDAKKELLSQLTKDGYDVNNGDVEIVPKKTGDKTISYDKDNAGHYTMTVNFRKKTV